MELSKLINSVKVIQVSGQVERKDIENITYDSRKVKNNSLFIAIPGLNSDGHKFILDAINKGATAVILQDNSIVPEDIFIHRVVTKILVKDSRSALAEVSNAFYKEPTKKIKLIGITGTKGKTTTSFFLKNIIETAGYKCGLVGTIANYIAEREIKSTLTTPESSDLNSLFAEMVSEDCKFAVMEVSSHSLILKRVVNLTFCGTVFTNITSDHLDFHKTFEEYFKAKKILFDSMMSGSFIIYNSEDTHSKEIISDSKSNCFSYGKTAHDFRINNITYDLNGTKFIIEYLGKSYELKTSLIGEFNAYNAAAAFAVAALSSININDAIKGIESTPQVPGRFETIHSKNKKIIIDYSHTADSLEKALQAIHNIVGNSRPVYTVFGCGGNRDRTKRPVMGNIASNLSKKAFITSDNPRFENPMDIINEIIKGIEKDNYEVIENREVAIKTAIKTTEENSVILIAGKGHETYQEIKGIRNHFSDKEVAEKFLVDE